MEIEVHNVASLVGMAERDTAIQYKNTIRYKNGLGFYTVKLEKARLLTLLALDPNFKNFN